MRHLHRLPTAPPQDARAAYREDAGASKPPKTCCGRLDLLTNVIEVNQEDPEFFIRKAIGWALRDYARTDGDWVRAFVQAHPGLSPLSQREALKRL